MGGPVICRRQSSSPWLRFGSAVHQEARNQDFDSSYPVHRSVKLSAARNRTQCTYLCDMQARRSEVSLCSIESSEVPSDQLIFPEKAYVLNLLDSGPKDIPHIVDYFADAKNNPDRVYMSERRVYRVCREVMRDSEVLEGIMKKDTSRGPRHVSVLFLKRHLGRVKRQVYGRVYLPPEVLGISESEPRPTRGRKVLGRSSRRIASARKGLQRITYSSKLTGPGIWFSKGSSN